MRRLGALALALLVLSAGARTHAAQPSEPERQARRLFASAEDHFRSGLFAEALAEYQAGYDIHPLPGFLINIAQCQRRLGNLAVAQATYRKFIMVAPDSPFVPQVKALMAELEALSQDLAVPTANQATPEAAKSKQDDVPPAPPLSAQSPPDPSATSAVDLVSAPTPAPQATSQTRWWLWGLIGAAAAGAVTTIVLVSLPAGTNTVHDGSVGTLRR